MNNTHFAFPTVEQLLEPFLEGIREVIRSEIKSNGMSLPEEIAGQRFAWVNTKEAMIMTGLSKSTLARYRKTGMLPYAEFGSSKNLFYKISDINRILEDSLKDLSSSQ